MITIFCVMNHLRSAVLIIDEFKKIILCHVAQRGKKNKSYYVFDVVLYYVK